MWFTQLYHLNLKLFHQAIISEEFCTTDHGSAEKGILCKLRHETNWSRVIFFLWKKRESQTYMFCFICSPHSLRKKCNQKQWKVKPMVMSLTANTFSPTVFEVCHILRCSNDSHFQCSVKLVSLFCCHICLLMSQ